MFDDKQGTQGGTPAGEGKKRLAVSGIQARGPECGVCGHAHFFDDGCDTSPAPTLGEQIGQFSIGLIIVGAFTFGMAVYFQCAVMKDRESVNETLATLDAALNKRNLRFVLRGDVTKYEFKEPTPIFVLRYAPSGNHSFVQRIDGVKIVQMGE